MAVLARAVILLITATLTLGMARDSRAVHWLALIAIAALPASIGAAHQVIGPLARLAEIVLTALAAATLAATPSAGISAGQAAAAILPYLPVPVIAATLHRRKNETVWLLAVAGVVLGGAALLDPRLREVAYLGACAEWVVLTALAASIAGAQQHSLLARRNQPQPYAEATRLLTQLRGVARQLPGATLDPGGLAEHLLEDLQTTAPVTRAAVLSASGGGRLVVLAQHGAERVAWETALDTESAIADAWASQQPHTTNRSQARSGTSDPGEISALVVPLVAGVRTVGLVAMETDTPGAYPPHIVAKVIAIAAPAALRLEAALLFDEVRSLATTEERQRLAREIHDGVAQELVMVGYGIDNALAALPDVDAAAQDLRSLRSEVTRVITELRLSLFELRSEVDRYGGLTAAIADYARNVCASAGLRVHLSLDESTARLPAATEAELLRIAQEAITNARKHAGAENLWVTCIVDPPFAQVEVSDDGKGIADPHPGGRYGLTIMAERAERIRGRLEITPRVPNGTTVAVVLGTAPRRGSV
ncbi:MAG: GAF domain-containing sensor histidine kinase [Micromonosporaceae bacterium]|nr:GAF domain-containing sensor histidine kinase [Micromonosporaceae bacterium]